MFQLKSRERADMKKQQRMHLKKYSNLNIGKALHKLNELALMYCTRLFQVDHNKTAEAK